MAKVLSVDGVESIESVEPAAVVEAPAEPAAPRHVTRAELAGILRRLGPCNDVAFSAALAREAALLEG